MKCVSLNIFCHQKIFYLRIQRPIIQSLHKNKLFIESDIERLKFFYYVNVSSQDRYRFYTEVPCSTDSQFQVLWQKSSERLACGVQEEGVRQFISFCQHSTCLALKTKTKTFRHLFFIHGDKYQGKPTLTS